MVFLSLLIACDGSTPSRRSATAPIPDDENVIAYQVDVVEDDSDCGAKIPIKESTEELIVAWHGERDITMYLRGGLYQKDVLLHDDGTYEYSGVQGKCLPGSYVRGRIDRYTGEGSALCRKYDCDVSFTSTAKRRVDGGTG